MILAVLFFLTAIAYSIAGFGGGSTYLALLVLFDEPLNIVRTVALLCNVAVVTFGTYHFARSGHLRLHKVLPFVVTSIPMAFVGGTIQLDETMFKLLLGGSLAVAAMRMLWLGKAIEPRTDLSVRTSWMVGLPLGALLGFLAGLVGIGGGIYLAPVLLFIGWTDAKQTAACASFFILVNSIAGLAGQAVNGIEWDSRFILPLLIAVLIGGQIGSRIGAGTLPKVAMQRVTGVLILAVSARLLWGLL